MLVRLAVAMMAADGRITSGELSAAGALDGLGLGPLSALMGEEIERAVKQPIDLDDTCAHLARLSPEAGLVVLSILAEIAAADGVVSAPERDTLRAVATRMKLPPGSADEALARQEVGLTDGPERSHPAEAAGAPTAPSPGSSAPKPQPSRSQSGAAAASESLARAYALLGVRPGASRVELEDAYRLALDRYNPTKVIDLGTEFASLAVRKLAQATAAFEFALSAAAPPGT
jgi:DnaJ-domain-containing protein 1